jgi:hypothetical protein
MYSLVGAKYMRHDYPNQPPEMISVVGVIKSLSIFGKMIQISLSKNNNRSNAYVDWIAEYL